jgi:hypothetical protein
LCSYSLAVCIENEVRSHSLGVAFALCLVVEKDMFFLVRTLLAVLAVVETRQRQCIKLSRRRWQQRYEFVKSRSGHHMRGSGGPQVRNKWVYIMVSGMEYLWETLSIYGKSLLSSRWLIPDVAQPQCCHQTLPTKTINQPGHPRFQEAYLLIVPMGTCIVSSIVQYICIYGSVSNLSKVCCVPSSTARLFPRLSNSWMS